MAPQPYTEQHTQKTTLRVAEDEELPTRRKTRIHFDLKERGAKYLPAQECRTFFPQIISSVVNWTDEISGWIYNITDYIYDVKVNTGPQFNIIYDT